MVGCLIDLRQGRFGHSIRRVGASAERELALSHLAHQTHLAPHDRVHKGGQILFVSSVLGLFTIPGNSYIKYLPIQF